MPRRVGLPGAAELFRPTVPESGDGQQATPPEAVASGRVRHEEKITVYVSRDELLALEQARLRLRAEHGLAVDRGRIVRTARGLVMAELDARGGDSDLVRALTDQ